MIETATLHRIQPPTRHEIPRVPRPRQPWPLQRLRAWWAARRAPAPASCTTC